MKIYIYDKGTKEFLYSSNAQENPRKAGEYLFPKNSTTIIPPTPEKNKVSVFNGEYWDVIPDFRGLEIVNIDTLEITKAKEIGELPSDYMLYSDYVLTSEYKQRVKEQEIQDKKDEILSQMKTFDEKRIRAVCEPSIKDTKSGETWLDYYNSQIALLRQKLEEVSYDT